MPPAIENPSPAFPRSNVISSYSQEIEATASFWVPTDLATSNMSSIE